MNKDNDRYKQSSYWGRTVDMDPCLVDAFFFSFSFFLAASSLPAKVLSFSFLFLHSVSGPALASGIVEFTHSCYQRRG